MTATSRLQSTAGPAPRRALRCLLSAVCAAACAALMPATAAAQDDEGPAIDTSGGALRSAPPAAAPEDAAPAVETTPRRPAEGTTIFGEDENPIGLYIIPWRASSPSPQLDRPARFVDETEQPIDRAQFVRFVEYYEALTRHRQAQMDAAGSGSGP